MALPKGIDVQRDFTAGEIDVTAKRRDDDEFVKRGMRQLSNSRILNTGAVTQRPGRIALQNLQVQARVEEVLMAPGIKYRLNFVAGFLRISDTTGAVVATFGGQPWAANNLKLIVWAIYLNQIFITFPGMQPLALTWDGVSAWTMVGFSEMILGFQKRTPFYRISPKNIVLTPSAQTGTVSLVTDQPYFTAGMVGTRIRFIGRQILITVVTNPQTATGEVQEPLPGVQSLHTGTLDPVTIFAVGDVIRGSISGAEGIITSFHNGSGDELHVQLLTLGTSTGLVDAVPAVEAFIGTDTIVSSAGSAPLVGVSAISGINGVSVWDEEVMNAYRGWPRSVTVDQGRLIFSDFPALPNGIAWSAEGSPTDLNIGPLPIDGFFELAPGKNRVLYVVAGMDGTEFVFCDNGIFHIPITPANPLKPGSVQFQQITGDGAAQVQPRKVGGVVVYVDQGLNQVQSIVATGSYSRFYESMPLTDLHSHLFNNIQAIALPTSVTQFPERYAYVLNGDGTIAVGKYMLKTTGEFAGRIGWVPWNGSWNCKWISALNDIILFVDAYTVGATTAYMLDQLDATQYLDTSILVNALPPALVPPGGKGPLWWLPGATVDLMDGLLPLGPHATDANGFLIPLFPGEDLTSATLRAGFTWTGIWEPFVLASTGAQDTEARMKKRSIARFETYVTNSTGFRFAKLYSGKIGPMLPALGDIMSDRRIPAYNQGDDATLPMPLRDDSYAYKPRKRSSDPRACIIKDTPGPLTLVEIAAKASI